MTSKRLLREAAKARRHGLVRAAPDFARRIVAFIDFLPIPKGAIVAGYWPLKDEADPRLLMHAVAQRGHKLALPVVDADARTLSFHEWKEGDPTSLNDYGIVEPLAADDPVEPGVILVPLLAFDASGHRLGYGGGYYDRTLERMRIRAIGIAYAGQEVKELPRGQHDRPLNMILTERGLRRFE
jgi:5-formyltetrahydrofolate cyclo-ligase